MTRKTPEDEAKRPEELTFEQALERLDACVAGMESGELPLEEMLKVFEEGQRLTRFCQKKLDEIEKRIEIITRDQEGREVTEDFPVAEGEDA